MSEARRGMAMFPDGAVLSPNPVSAAPGYRLDNVFVFAGVPRIMQAMFDGSKHMMSGGAPMLSRAVSVMLGEGAIAEGLGALQPRYPDIDIGSYPAMRRRRFGVSVVLRGTHPARLDAALAELKQLLTDLGGAPDLVVAAHCFVHIHDIAPQFARLLHAAPHRPLSGIEVPRSRSPPPPCRFPPQWQDRLP